MMTEFDEMSARELRIADADLAHIAETEQLTDSELDRITAKVLGRIDLTPLEPEITVRHSKKRRFRVVGALIAAVVAAGALGLGVSGWLNYNKPLMQGFFGSLGDERLAELNLPEPQTFTNGIVNARVEACLRDSVKMLVLITFEGADPEHPINWSKLMDEYCRKTMDPSSEETFGYHEADPIDPLFIYNFQILDEDGEPNGMGGPQVGFGGPLITNLSRGGAGVVPSVKTKKGITCVEYEFQIVNPDFDPESIVLRFENAAQGRLDVTVPVTPRLESAYFENEEGARLTVSPIGFRREPACLIPMLDNSWINVILNRTDGTQTKGYLGSVGTSGGHNVNGRITSINDGRLYEVTDGMEFQYNDPDSYTGFVDVSDVESIEWLDEIYYRVEE